MNNFLHRSLIDRLMSGILPNKVAIILGARRVGKTMLLNHLIKNDFPGKILSLNGEDQSVVSVLGNRTIENYKQLTSGYDYLVIDEAQKIPDIGNVLKLVVDHIEGLRVVVTGSSVFDLSNKLGEPLTGRKSTFYMFPLAQMEYSGSENLIETRARLEGRMIFGNYPELLQYSSDKDKAAYLNELVGSYLLKDILEYDGLRDSSKMLNLLRLIAFQIGKEVSLEELGRQLGLSRNTVEKHLDLLTKVFVIYKVSGFSRNLRSEVTKTSRWYFFDNGVRNALISNFNPLNLRNDTGELWENYLLSERIKFQQYTGMLSSNYFWRTYQQQEIDWIEDRSGMLHAFEIKWGTNKTFKPPSAWVNAYPDSTFEVITPDNYLLWIQSED